MKFPTEFELPRPEDFCRGAYVKGEKKCTMEWIDYIFSNVSDSVRQTFASVAKEMKLHAPDGYSGYFFLSRINDNPRNSDEQLAAWFERSVIKIGYEVVEDD